MSERCVGAPALSAGRFISQIGGIVEEIMMNRRFLGLGIPMGAIFQGFMLSVSLRGQFFKVSWFRYPSRGNFSRYHAFGTARPVLVISELGGLGSL